ncbi:transcriptional regulator, LysR family [Thalassococcus halodurans]|jgi:DNA-binding transcriptional LysR family regulator|uniref:Transcriptional regulator, LysR family n=1 Tax=Thalassococcus halodurans TaxID=373675 RepID=A0A1H6A8D8_9RHOB|nr:MULTISPECIES: LysR family transcriptional regulator [Thalassococcus]MBO6868803.1 LysR family transcriptional regulator [Thalassococcus sp.]SEG43996.1 transcriptional regulator, LysR family [Thalassococcus halodurans]
MRNLDLGVLRSFMTVADAGGVTRAAGILNLTQSAVSMQLKRLEETLGVPLLERSGRGLRLTSSGEQLLHYSRKLVALNDEAWGKLTAEDYEGELRLGVPHDVIYPTIPQVLKKFSADFPRMKVQLISLPSLTLKKQFAQGECDLILTTELQPDAGGEILALKKLVWIGAINGSTWRERPLRVAFCSNCIFRPGTVEELGKSGIPWEYAVDSENDNAVEAAVSADLAIHVTMEGNLPAQTEAIDHGDSLPDPGRTGIVMYVQKSASTPIAGMADILRAAFAAA